MKRLKVWIAGGFLTLTLSPGVVSAMGIELGVGAWSPNPKGDISYKGDSLSLKDNLKYSEDIRIFGRAKIDTPLFFPNIYLMATPLRFSETGSKSTPFQFGGATFAANTPFSSELKLDHYDVGFTYGIPVLKTATFGMLNIDLGVNARIIDFKERVTGQDLGSVTITESKALVIPLPMLYFGFQVKPLKWVAAEGEARGVAYGGNHYYDIIGRVKLKPFGPVFAAGGYRYEKINIDRDDVKAKASFGGPFGEIGVEF